MPCENRSIRFNENPGFEYWLGFIFFPWNPSSLILFIINFKIIIIVVFNYLYCFLAGPSLSFSLLFVWQFIVSIFSIFSFLLWLPLSSVSQIMNERCSSFYSFNFYLSLNGLIKKCLLRIWPLPLAFVRRTFFWSVLSSPIHSGNSLLLSLSILSSPFSSSTTFQSSSAPIFLVSRSLTHIKQCSKHISSFQCLACLSRVTFFC